MTRPKLLENSPPSEFVMRESNSNALFSTVMAIWIFSSTETPRASSSRSSRSGRSRARVSAGGGPLRGFLAVVRADLAVDVQARATDLFLLSDVDPAVAR